MLHDTHDLKVLCSATAATKAVTCLNSRMKKACKRDMLSIIVLMFSKPNVDFKHV